MADDVDPRLASLNEARELFIRSLKTHEQFVYKLGYEAGFAAGWDAVVRRLAASKPDISLAAERGDLTDLLNQYEAKIPARDPLLSIVTLSPGSDWREIAEIARRNVPTLNERTVRTGLARLKEAGELRVDDGKWYVAQKEAARTVFPNDFDE